MIDHSACWPASLTYWMSSEPIKDTEKLQTVPKELSMLSSCALVCVFLFLPSSLRPSLLPSITLAHSLCALSLNILHSLSLFCTLSLFHSLSLSLPVSLSLSILPPAFILSYDLKAIFLICFTHSDTNHIYCTSFSVRNRVHFFFFHLEFSPHLSLITPFFL